MKNISDKVEKKIKHILCSVTLNPKIVPFMTMWKNTVEPNAPQMTTHGA
jgi:hypothetical protein